MPTNGIHLVLGISGICPFFSLHRHDTLHLLPLCLLPSPTGVYRFLTFVFSSYSICMYFLLVHNSTKKRRIFCTLYIFVCWRSVARLRIRNVGLIYQKQHFVLRCIVVCYVCFDKLCKWHAREACQAAKQMPFSPLLLGFFALLPLPIVQPAPFRLH